MAAPQATEDDEAQAKFFAALEAKNYGLAYQIATERLGIETDNTSRFYWLLRRAVARGEQGRTDEGIADLNSALTLEPNNALALSMRADFNRVLRRVDDAVRDANAALAIEPKNEIALNARAASSYFSTRRAALFLPRKAHALQGMTSRRQWQSVGTEGFAFS